MTEVEFSDADILHGILGSAYARDLTLSDVLSVFERNKDIVALEDFVAALDALISMKDLVG